VLRFLSNLEGQIYKNIEESKGKGNDESNEVNIPIWTKCGIPLMLCTVSKEEKI